MFQVQKELVSHEAVIVALFEEENTSNFVQELDKASYYIERNANGKMLFHALSIKLYHIISNNSLILVN